jgi:hypothetical protein
MARIKPLDANDISPSVREAFEKHVASHDATITNMKATLAHSLLAFDVYMQWYLLYEKVQDLIGNRAAMLYAYSISYASNCPLCSTFFRRLIVQSGSKPEDLVLNDHERKLMDFGSSIALYKGCIADFVYEDLSRFHSKEEMVVLTAFAGQMVATNIFSNVTETDIDAYLQDYIPAKFNV